MPPWLFRLTALGFGLLLLASAALAAALALGAADPPRAGPLAWEDDFRAGLGRWEVRADPGATLAWQAGGFTAEFTAAGQSVYALADGPAGDFTLEMGGGQTAGEPGTAYGLAFAWQSPGDHAAVLVNANSYAEAYQLQAGVRRDWFAWQQWPHILALPESNRVRVDVRRSPDLAGDGRMLTVRVNDEVLARAASARGGGRLGLIARSSGPGRVVFSWIRLWTPAP